jgi:hypothetical protein
MDVNDKYYKGTTLPVDGWIHPCIYCKAPTSREYCGNPKCKNCLPEKIETQFSQELPQQKIQELPQQKIQEVQLSSELPQKKPSKNRNYKYIFDKLLHKSTV